MAVISSDIIVMPGLDFKSLIGPKEMYVAL